jgi:hypothetical protein
MKLGGLPLCSGAGVMSFNRKDMPGLRPFTSQTAPRQGRMKGSRNKLNARAWKVIDTLLADYKEHGDKAVDYLRIEKPYEYVKAALAATEIALKYTQAQQGGNALVNISINRFFPDKEPTVTIDGVSDGQPAS